MLFYASDCANSKEDKFDKRRNYYTGRTSGLDFKYSRDSCARCGRWYVDSPFYRKQELFVERLIKDASGISIIIQTFAILNKHGWAGTRAIEFHAYGVRDFFGSRRSTLNFLGRRGWHVRIHSNSIAIQDRRS
jgi:hypothetical protein